MPTTYLKRLYFDALVYTHHQLQYLVDLYGADHILVGTDYPADMGEIDPIGFIEGCPGLDDTERRAILGRNAARLLNLECLPGLMSPPAAATVLRDAPLGAPQMRNVVGRRKTRHPRLAQRRLEDAAALVHCPPQHQAPHVNARPAPG